MEFTIGDLRIRKVFELDGYLPMPALFPDLAPADLQRLRRWYWSEELSEDPQAAAIKLSFHSFILQVGGKNILIDTCNGNHKKRPFWSTVDQLNTAYMDNFRATGVTPEDIDFVLCTHLHFDHVGWNTRLENGRWVPTFPNARYLFSRLDYEHYSQHTDDPAHGPSYLDSLLPVVEHGLAELVETDRIVEHDVGNGVWLQGAPGHTPGNCAIHAQRGGPEAIFTGDVFHHPVQLVRPDMPMSADADPAMGSRTRTAILARHANTNAIFFSAHFSGTSAGHIVRDGSEFRFDFLSQG
jgi:glyoxylase-like metal-dependent hydrolase (beta-lactamase superfamily II)